MRSRIRSSKSSSVADKGRKECFSPELEPGDLESFPSSGARWGLVVLSGGGTSGRMAFLMSGSFNQLMKSLGQKPLYTYLIAGGDRSVVASRERTEDSALHRIEELKKAPFVAGQMDYCMDNPDIFLPVLVGFNPVSMAR
ncbi:glucokinase regulatory protein-like isoform X2 [Grammomys surdaster]|uniref:glucokinase regulatory protein-like isoform X2 n=1 Tax=Grammomys surdaster TaxID=491861 RepID=UPI00109F964F|nr:glucokinase regulatory protein-like isoform X2 [Grammomys surdaster]